MKRIKLGFILVIFLFPVRIEPAIPVHDPITMVKEVLQFAQELQRWKNYLMTFRALEQKFYRRFNAALKAQIGMGLYEIEALVHNFFEPGMLQRRVYWGDIINKDIWANIWKNRTTIKDKYPSLKKEVEKEIVRKNPYYKANKEWAKFQDENLKQQQIFYQDLQDHAKMYGDMRALANFRTPRYKTFMKMISSFSRKWKDDDPEKSAAAIGKLMGVMCELYYERLILTNELNALVRTYLERKLKKVIFRLDYEKRRRILNKNKDKNVELIKQLYEYMP